MSDKLCRTCRHFEHTPWDAGKAGWCRHPNVDPDDTGIKLLFRANELGCALRRPLWWEPAEPEVTQPVRAQRRRTRLGGG